MRQLLTKRLLAPVACLALALALAEGAAAQTPETDDGPRKFDEFNQLRGCDLGARLDNFAIALQADESVSGYIISYGPQGKGSGTGERNLAVMADYLVNSRGLDRERFKTVYGGPYKDPKDFRTELWVVPPGAQPPALKKYENDIKSFRGKYEEYLTTDHFFEGAESPGPSAGSPSFASFVETLRQQTGTRAYIVVHSSQRAATGAWRRVAKGVADSIKDDSGVAADRVKIIFAGYDEKLGREDSEEGYGELRVQLWILPEDAPPPATEVKTERRPMEAVQIGKLSRYTFPDSYELKRLYEGLADVLTADRELRACIIYRPSTQPVEQEAGPDTIPSLDLVRLVEKWKADLAAGYRIDESRLVIIPAAATVEWDEGTLEAWVVPPGATLPDPYPPQEEYVEEASEENPPGS